METTSLLICTPKQLDGNGEGVDNAIPILIHRNTSIVTNDNEIATLFPY